MSTRNNEFEFYRGWDIFYDPRAKAYKWTAWRGSSYQKNLRSLRARTLEELRNKIDKV